MIYSKLALTVLTASISSPILVAEASKKFQLQMYHDKNSCWQENCDRKYEWCLRCGSIDCYLDECDRGDRDQYFTFTDRGQMKKAHDNKCLERVKGKKTVQQRSCSSSQGSQRWEGFKSGGSKFELHPKGSSSFCLTNYFHHPRDDEPVYITKCSKAGDSRTSYWRTRNEGSGGNDDGDDDDDDDDDNCDKAKKSSSKLKDVGGDPRCKLGRCIGDCDDDSDCKDDLKCFQRDKFEDVPGCGGDGKKGWDYCYDKKKSF